MSDHLGEYGYPISRKSHRCSWCGEIIQKGEKYAKQFVICEGDAWTKKLHLECETAECAFDFDGDIHHYNGQMQRGHNHEPGWDTIYRCAEVGCPKCLEVPLSTSDDVDLDKIIKLVLNEKVVIIDAINQTHRISFEESSKVLNVVYDLLGIKIEPLV